MTNADLIEAINERIRRTNIGTNKETSASILYKAIAKLKVAETMATALGLVTGCDRKYNPPCDICKDEARLALDQWEKLNGTK